MCGKATAVPSPTHGSAGKLKVGPLAAGAAKAAAARMAPATMLDDDDITSPAPVRKTAGGKVSWYLPPCTDHWATHVFVAVPTLDR